MEYFFIFYEKKKKLLEAKGQTGSSERELTSFMMKFKIFEGFSEKVIE